MLTPEEWRDVVQEAITEAAEPGKPFPVVQLETTPAGWAVTVLPPQQVSAPADAPVIE